MHYYEVAPTKIVRTDSHFYTYASNEPYAIGSIVEIPVGKKTLLGVILRGAKKPRFETKEIIRAIEPTPLPHALITTALWMSDYYATHLALVLSAILPTGVDKNRRVIKEPARLTAPIREAAHHTPTPAQQQAISNIVASLSPTQILHGVTGSGKTLVYIECVKHAFKQGRSAIVLVPEISLTSQIVDEFRQTFGDDVLLTHSKQTERERHAVWKKTLNASTPKVVIGPRSALFLPLASLGIIIVDESHEPSYKQEQAPRYSALRTATILAKNHSTTALFGSATPLVSDYFLAQSRNAPIHHLSESASTRVTKPAVTLVDMTKKANFTQHRFLSDALLAAINTTLENNKQVLVFHNRRGTTAITLCKKCGWTATDPDTDIPLTLHADKHRLISHTSTFTMNVPTSCPACGEVDIVHKGIGTKLLETELRRLYPNKNIVRFDGDSDDDKNVATLYHDLYSGAIDIIIGTQVVAKGLDLPHLALVGVVQGDTGLALPDFSADERTFQLLAQVVGRVGRSSLASTVVVQSYHPSHIAITAGLSQDYMAFYNHTLMQRKQHLLPPFSYLLKLVCVYKTEAAAIRNAKSILRQLRADAPPHTIFTGPSPSFYEKQHGSYRWQIIAKSPLRTELLDVARRIPQQHWQYELDPVDLL